MKINKSRLFEIIQEEVEKIQEDEISLQEIDFDKLDKKKIKWAYEYLTMASSRLSELQHYDKSKISKIPEKYMIRFEQLISDINSAYENLKSSWQESISLQSDEDIEEKKDK